MGLLKITTMALAILFIAACSQPDPPPQKKGTVLDPMLKQKDKARDVQNVIDQSADRNRDAVDKQERGDSSQ